MSQHHTVLVHIPDDDDYRHLYDQLSDLPVQQRVEAVTAVRYFIRRLIQGLSREAAGAYPPHWTEAQRRDFERGMQDPAFVADGVAWLLGGGAA